MNALWIICLILAGGFIALAVKCLLSTNERSIIKIVKMVLYLAEASFFLYLPVFFLQNNFLTALAADLINVMRVVSLDAGYLDHKDFIIQNIGNGFFFRIYMVALGLLHFLMPLLSIMAVYSIFFMFFSHIRVLMINLQHGRPVFVFNTSGNRAVLLASDIQKKVPKGAFIFAGIKDKSQRGEVDLLNSTIIHPDSIENININRKKNRDVYYFLFSDDENTNIKEALDQIEFMSQKDEEIQKHTHIFVGVESDEAESLIDSSSKGEVDVHIIRAEELAVYKLIDEHPLYDSAENNFVSVLVIGLDTIGEAFVKVASWCGQICGCRLKINVVGIDIAKNISDFSFRYPGYKDCTCLDLNFYDCAGNQELFDTILKNCKDITYAVIAQGTDMENTETAIRLRRELLKQDDSYSRTPQIYAYICNKEQADVLDNLRTSEIDPRQRASYKLVSFGCEEEIFTYDNIVDSDRECLGKNTHMVYESILFGDKLNVSEALAHYNMLEVGKCSNTSFAMHIRYKLSQLGLDYTRDAEADEVDFYSYLSEEKLDELNILEHDRWQMFMISEGWSGTDMDDVQAYKDSGMSLEKYFSPLLKLHPFICSFDELNLRSEYLGGDNIAIYDKELIRRIPDILHDCWDVTGVKFKIIKKNDILN